MQSSPFMSSSMPQGEDDQEPQTMKSIIMCREEDLEAVTIKFIQPLSSHIYSLGPCTIQNLQIIADCNRKICEGYATEDPLKVGHQYGAIKNAQVRRKTGTKPVLAASTSAFKRPNPETSSQRTSSPAATRSKPEPSQRKAQEKTTISKTLNLKKEQSDIFKAFARPRAQVSRENTDSSAGAPSVRQPDSPAADSALGLPENVSDASESEGADSFAIESKDADSLRGTTRYEREENLRNMMNDDDDAEATGPTKTEADEHSTIQTAEEQPQEEPTTSIVASVGRRRGRRKIMKKKMLKDEEGYLVTKEEPAWESFSEDEPPPKEATPVSTASSAAKGRKGAGKPGQGNIASFFGKK